MTILANLVDPHVAHIVLSPAKSIHYENIIMSKVRPEGFGYAIERIQALFQFGYTCVSFEDELLTWRL